MFEREIQFEVVALILCRYVGIYSIPIINYNNRGNKHILKF